MTTYQNFIFPIDVLNEWKKEKRYNYRLNYLSTSDAFLYNYKPKFKKGLHELAALLEEKGNCNMWQMALDHLNVSTSTIGNAHLVDFVFQGIENKKIDIEKQYDKLYKLMRCEFNNINEISIKNKFKILKSLIEFNKDASTLLPQVLKEYSKWYPFDITFKEKLKLYVDSLDIQEQKIYDNVKTHWSELDEEVFLTSKDYYVYSANINTNILANYKKLKTAQVQQYIMTPLYHFVTLLNQKKILNTSSCLVDVVSINRETVNAHNFQIDFTVKDQSSRNNIEKAFFIIINKLVEEISKKPPEYTEKDVESMVNSWMLESMLSSETSNTSKRNKI